MWLKFVLSGLVILFCAFLGWLAAGKFRSRKKFFGQFATFNERYLTELCYARKPLPEFIKEYPYHGDFAKALTAFMNSRDINFRFSFLNKEEKKLCSDYFGMLGKGDAVSQKSYYSAQKGELEAKRSATEKEAKSRGELYLKLGLLAGLAFVILIV